MLAHALGPEPTVEHEDGAETVWEAVFPRRKMNALSVGFPGHEKSGVTPR